MLMSSKRSHIDPRSCVPYPNSCQISDITQVPFPEDVKIVKIAAGENFSVALSEKGVIWTWGSNNAGQLGYQTMIW